MFSDPSGSRGCHDRLRSGARTYLHLFRRAAPRGPLAWLAHGSRTRTFLLHGQALWPIELQPTWIRYSLVNVRPLRQDGRLAGRTGVRHAGVADAGAVMGESERVDSNHRPYGCRPSALAAELRPTGARGGI
jgi:hypothetical protein